MSNFSHSLTIDTAHYDVTQSDSQSYCDNDSESDYIASSPSYTAHTTPSFSPVSSTPTTPTLIPGSADKRTSVKRKVGSILSISDSIESNTTSNNPADESNSNSDCNSPDADGGSHSHITDKKERRKAQNRSAAATSRLRKKAYMTEMEDKMSRLAQRTMQMEQQMRGLMAENARLKQITTQVKGAGNATKRHLSTPVTASGRSGQQQHSQYHHQSQQGHYQPSSQHHLSPHSYTQHYSLPTHTHASFSSPQYLSPSPVPRHAASFSAGCGTSSLYEIQEEAIPAYLNNPYEQSNGSTQQGIKQETAAVTVQVQPQEAVEEQYYQQYEVPVEVEQNIVLALPVA